MRQRLSDNQNSIFSKTKDFFRSHWVKVAVVGALFILLVNFMANRNNSSADIQQVGSPVDIQYDIIIPAQNSEGDTVNRDFNVKVTDAQRQRRVLVKGNWVRAREGKIFIVVNMDVTNDSRAILYANPVDWARLVASGEKRIAPTVHQGDLEIRPQSTKLTNIAFVVDEDQQNATIELGRIWGLDDTIEIEF